MCDHILLAKSLKALLYTRTVPIVNGLIILNVSMKVCAMVVDKTETGIADTIIIRLDVQELALALGIMEIVTEDSTTMENVGVMAVWAVQRKGFANSSEARGDVAHQPLGIITHINMQATLGKATQLTELGMQKPSKLMIIRVGGHTE